MQNTINLQNELDLPLKIRSYTISSINLSSDGRGIWNILVTVGLRTPNKSQNLAGVFINEKFNINARVEVTRAEIAAAANIDEEDVRNSLTLEQTENIVTQIALTKLTSSLVYTLP